MTNEERIKQLRKCATWENCSSEMCNLYLESECRNLLLKAAADALEAADEKIADYAAAIEALDDSNDAYIKENERLKNRIAEMEKSYSWKAYAALEESIEGYKTRIAELEAQIPKKEGYVDAEN